MASRTVSWNGLVRGDGERRRPPHAGRHGRRQNAHIPNANVAAQAEAQLRSVLAIAMMQFQRAAKVTTSGGKLWEAFMPEETKAHIAEQAEALVKTISDGGLLQGMAATHGSKCLVCASAQPTPAQDATAKFIDRDAR